MCVSVYVFVCECVCVCTHQLQWLFCLRRFLVKMIRFLVHLQFAYRCVWWCLCLQVLVIISRRLHVSSGRRRRRLPLLIIVLRLRSSLVLVASWGLMLLTLNLLTDCITNSYVCAHTHTTTKHLDGVVLVAWISRPCRQRMRSNKTHRS